MKIIVGLGNPGKQYEKTRHNVGFLFLEKFLYDIAFTKNLLIKKEWYFDKKFNSEIAEIIFNSEKAILAKPQTYMNESGKAVRALADYYKITANDIFVIYDDIDLPIGTVRIGKYDSAGGHKGVQSIIDRLKSNNFVRFRVGIKNDKADKQPAEKFVLKKFGLSEKAIINDAQQKTVAAVKMALDSPLETVMNEYN